MANLSSTKVSDTFPDLLHLYNGTAGQGLTSDLKLVYDGDGTSSSFSLGSGKAQFTGLLYLNGSTILQNKSSGALASAPQLGEIAFINNELYIGK
jgi:hypothetical protein